MFKWSVSKSIVTDATAKNVWKLWSDVSSWQIWDKEVEWTKIDGNFVLHAKGEIKPKGFPVAKIEILELTQNKSFTSGCKSIPFTTMTFDHSLKVLDHGKIMIKHAARISGLFAPILYFTMRKNLEKGLMEALQNLSELAQK